MFSSSQIIALIFIVALTVVVVVLTQKAIQVFKEQKLNRKEAEEHEEMLEAVAQAKESRFATSDGLVEGLIKDHEVVWVGLKGKTRHDSFEELFRHENMPIPTYEELIEIRDSLKQVQDFVVGEMYTPKFFTTLNTTEELGRDVVIYRHGNIRLTDRLIVTIGENPKGKDVETQRVLISYGCLEDTSRSVFDLNFLVTEDNPQDKVDANFALLKELLSKPTFKAESDKMDKVIEDIVFYNDLVRNDQIYFSKGRAYLRAIKSESKAPSEPVTPEVKSDLDDIIKSAIDGRPASEE